MFDWNRELGEARNLIFLGEAGSGKSEVALNAAAQLRAQMQAPVHFFDLDMTKPLFRSRDVAQTIEAQGVTVHFEEQFMDAPTLVGGVRKLLKDGGVYTVLDVGGDYIGARSIGGFQQELMREDTVVYYVLNAYRPWSDTMEHIDETLGKILGVSHVGLEKLRFIANSNLGAGTSKQQAIEGNQRLAELLKPYAKIAFSCMQAELIDEEQRQEETLFPMKLFLTYEFQSV